jgi:hypothetical protein
VILNDYRDRIYLAGIGFSAFLGLACLAASQSDIEVFGEGVALIVFTAAALLIAGHELMLWRVTLPEMGRRLPPRHADAVLLGHGVFPASLGLVLALFGPQWWLGLPFVLVSVVTFIFLWRRNTEAAV